MNREIKFRVWHKKSKEWYGTIGLNETISHCELDYEPDDLVYVQYAGLKDSNGYEIYEGDILNCDLVGGDDPQIVIFKDGMFTLDYLTPGCHTLHDEISQMVGHKVIGNIFEHKHLLEK